MDYIHQISFHQGVRNEEPNKVLAQLLSESENKEGIAEIVQYLFDKNKSIASDCLAVLYTVGYSKPVLIAEYLDTFIELLASNNNRMVWGSMIALSSIATVIPPKVYNHIDLIISTIQKGTVITEVWGLNTLVNLSLQDEKYKSELLPTLFEYLEKCRPIDFAKRIDTIYPAITNANDTEIITRIIEQKTQELSDSQAKKLKAILKKHQ